MRCNTSGAGMKGGKSLCWRATSEGGPNYMLRQAQLSGTERADHSGRDDRARESELKPPTQRQRVGHRDATNIGEWA
jgi:hypothetical protein